MTTAERAAKNELLATDVEKLLTGIDTNDLIQVLIGLLEARIQDLTENAKSELDNGDWDGAVSCIDDARRLETIKECADA